MPGPQRLPNKVRVAQPAVGNGGGSPGPAARGEHSGVLPHADPARARQVELILEQIEGLPTLSTVGTRLLQLGAAHEVKIDDVVKILETDPALSMRMLSLCRRADKGIREPIKTVKRAVLMLGFDAVRATALSVCVYDLMRGSAPAAKAIDAQVGGEESKQKGPPAFDRHGFWKHSVATACASELLARWYTALRVVPEEAFLAGLLHGVGRLVLEHVLPRSYEKVVRLAERRGCASAVVERALIGLDHHTAGRRVAEHWSLPGPVRDVIWLNGQSVAAVPENTDRVLLALVNVARAMCRHLHLGWSGDFGTPPDLDAAWAELGVKPAGISDLSEPLHSAVADRLQTLGLEDATPPALLAESLANANRELARLNESLRERAMQGETHARALGAIREFLAMDPAGRRLNEAAEIIAASARSVFHAKYVALLVPAETGWRLLTEGGTGMGAGLGGLTLSRGMSVTILDDPPGGSRAAAGLLAVSSGRAAMSVATLGLGTWLAEALRDGPDVRTLRLVPLPPLEIEKQLIAAEDAEANPEIEEIAENDPFATTLRTLRAHGRGAGNRGGGGGGTDGTERLSPVLVIDREPGEAGLSPASLGPLLMAWTASIMASRRLEQATRDSERLAEANRSLQESRVTQSQTESLVRLGEMAAGAAHEMNNPLAVIHGRAQLLAQQLSEVREKQAAEQISSAAKQLSELVAELHEATTRQRGEPSVVELRPMIDRVITAAGKRLQIGAAAEKPGVTNVIVEVDGVPSTVFVDPQMLEPVLEELVVNALQASPTAPVRVLCEVDALDGRLLLTVKDQGPGMSPKAMRHAFDAFFSERPAGRGRGLGLTRARRLARSMGGDIALHSVPGRGTTATVFLPEWQVQERRDAA